MQYIDKRKLEKRLAIINAVADTALTVAGVLKSTSGVLRKKPRLINKHLYSYKARADRRRTIACTIARLAISGAMGAAQVAIIASAPIPKFKPGSSTIVTEHGKEEIIYPTRGETGQQQ